MFKTIIQIFNGSNENKEEIIVKTQEGNQIEVFNEKPEITIYDTHSLSIYLKNTDRINRTMNGLLCEIIDLESYLKENLTEHGVLIEIHHQVNNEIPKLLDAYLLLDKGFAVTSIIKDGKTAKDFLIDNLKEKLNILLGYKNKFEDNKLKNFLNTSESHQNHVKKIDFKTNNKIDNYIGSFDYFHLDNLIENHLQRILTIGIDSQDMVLGFQEKNTNQVHDYLLQVSQKINEYLQAEDSINQSFLKKNLMFEISKMEDIKKDILLDRKNAEKIVSVLLEDIEIFKKFDDFIQNHAKEQVKNVFKNIEMEYEMNKSKTLTQYHVFQQKQSIYQEIQTHIENMIVKIMF